jgi:hypothetical protein
VAALQENNLEFIQASCRALDVTIPPEVIDETFMEDMRTLDSDWKEEQAKKEAEYKIALKDAADGCPDLVEKPRMQPSREYWENYLRAVVALFGRKGMGVAQKKVDDI